jgi:polysaccharide pyruvyl transferase WcaK-like protein
MNQPAGTRSILITSAFAHVNRGDWALTDAMLDVLAESFPGASIEALTRTPRESAEVFPAVRWHRLLGTSYRPFGPLRRIESSLAFVWGVARTAFSIRTGFFDTELSRSYRHADLIVLSAGGYFDASDIGILMHAAHFWLAVVARKPIAAAPMSIGPLDSRISRWYMARLLPSAALVMVRELSSFRLAKRLLNGGPARVHLVRDLALSSDVADLESARRELDAAGLSDRPLVCVVIAPVSPVVRPEPEILGALTEFCELLRNDGIGVFLWVQAETGGGVIGDEPQMREFAHRAPSNVTISWKRYSPDTIRGILSASLALVSLRMHPCIFASTVGCPFVALGRAAKTADFLRQLGLEEYLLSAASFDAHTLYGRVRAAIDDRARFQRARQRALSNGKRSSRVTAARLKRLIS